MCGRHARRKWLYTGAGCSVLTLGPALRPRIQGRDQHSIPLLALLSLSLLSLTHLLTLSLHTRSLAPTHVHRHVTWDTGTATAAAATEVVAATAQLGPRYRLSLAGHEWRRNVSLAFLSLSLALFLTLTGAALSLPLLVRSALKGSERPFRRHFPARLQALLGRRRTHAESKINIGRSAALSLSFRSAQAPLTVRRSSGSERRQTLALALTHSQTPTQQHTYSHTHTSTGVTHIR